MKKAIKIITVLCLAFTLFLGVAQPTISLAAGADDVVGQLNHDKTAGQTQITNLGTSVISFIWILSIVVAVVVVMYTGLKFIVGSANEKAEYKKSLVPIVVGVLLLVAATTIVKALFSVDIN